jgi:hypothetical protein
MPDEIKPFVRGDEIHKIKIMESLKTPIINLYKTYPLYYSYGIIETYFNGNFGDEIVTMLDKEGFIEIKPKTNPRQYRLTSRGVDLAISIINLENSERVLNFSNKTNKLTDWILTLTIVLAVTGLGQLLFVWLQLELLG